MTFSVLFHVNHLWGVGHFTRIAAIANAVVERGGAATILAGNTPVAGRLDPRVRLIELPVLRAPDPGYSHLVDDLGREPDADLWARRRAMIDQALDEAAADILVTETFPFGRRKLSPELLHMIAAAKGRGAARGAAIVSSIRDLPTAPSDTRRLEECAARLRDHYDAVLVHGDPMIVPLQDVWPGEVPAATTMTGYVAARPEPAGTRRQGVIVSAGGGNDAAALLRAAQAVRSGNALADEPWTFVAGPAAPPGFADILRNNLRSADIVLSSAPDLPSRIAAARLSISRGGYNTMCETVGAGTRCIVVPFAPPGEPEQGRRAACFAAEGLVTHLPEADLRPATLAAAIDAAMAAPPPGANALNLDGAANSAARLAEIAAGR